MALDPTARLANVKDSLKKYFIDNLYGTNSIPVNFDTSLSYPKIQGQPRSVTRWVNIQLGAMEMSDLSDLNIRIFCCTRNDPEGFRLAQLRDTVMGYLSDTTKTDGMQRITLYRSYENQSWETIGALLVQEVTEAPEDIAEDETKFIAMSIRLRWGSKI